MAIFLSHVNKIFPTLLSVHQCYALAKTGNASFFHTQRIHVAFTVHKVKL